MDAGQYNFSMAFQERINISGEKMAFYEETAEMYIGDDVSPDFYGWFFPKYDHVCVVTSTVVNRPAIKQSVIVRVIRLLGVRLSRSRLTPPRSTTCIGMCRAVLPLLVILQVMVTNDWARLSTLLPSLFAWQLKIL